MFKYLFRDELPGIHYGRDDVYVSGGISKFAECSSNRDNSLDFSDVWRFRDAQGFCVDKDIKSALKINLVPVLKAANANAGKIPPNGAWKITHLAELPALIKKINIKKQREKQFSVH